MISRLRHAHTRAKCAQVIIILGEKRELLTSGMISELSPVDGLVTYLQPAALILLAYIFPISPIPIMPTVKAAIFANEEFWLGL